MEDGRILNNQITVSSNPANIGGSRLTGPGGSTNSYWGPVVDDPDKWIQVDLVVQRLVTGVITQGRRRTSPNDGLLQFVTKFKVQFSNDGASCENVKVTDHPTEMVRTFMRNTHLKPI